MLRAGTNVVTPSFYSSITRPRRRRRSSRSERRVTRVVRRSSPRASTRDGSATFSAVLTGMSADIAEIRSREIFNYALYDQPDAVRTLIGFGGPMEATPPMLLDFALEMVWARSFVLLRMVLVLRSTRSALLSRSGRWNARSPLPAWATSRRAAWALSASRCRVAP